MNNSYRKQSEKGKKLTVKWIPKSESTCTVFLWQKNKGGFMNRKLLFAGLAALILILIWGCEKSPTGTTFDTDEEAITQMMLDNPEGFFSYEDHYGADDTTTVKDGKAERYTAWWRQILDGGRDITIHIEGDSAYVTFSAWVTGTFHLFVFDTIPPDTIIHYPKNLGDNFLRYAIFRRGTDLTEYRGWRLEKITGVEVTSDSNTVDIDSVRIECVSYPDTVITDPFVFVDRDNILTFTPGEQVQLTIYIDDSVYAFLHARGRCLGHCHWWRWRFNNVGVGIWTGTWTTPLIPSVRMAAFDILHQNTLDDNQYPYNSNAWIFPYRVQ